MIDKDITKNNGKHWSSEDNKKLEDWFGVYSFETIANKLGRTIKSIEVKKNKKGLGAAKKATEYVTAMELGEALGRNPSVIKYWIDNNDLPCVKKVIVRTQKCYRIDVNKFWKWAKENNKIMRWEMYNRNSLGKEPQWLVEELKNIKKNNTGKEWTTLEDLYLSEGYKNGKSLKCLSEEFARDVKAISNRIKFLKVPRRRIHITWKTIEDEILIDMRSKGIKFNKIAEELGRTTSSAVNRYKTISKNQIQA